MNGISMYFCVLICHFFKHFVGDILYHHIVLCIHSSFIFTSVQYYIFINVPQYICSFSCQITFNVKYYRLYCGEYTFPSPLSKYILVSAGYISRRELFVGRACMYLTLVDVISFAKYQFYLPHPTAIHKDYYFRASFQTSVSLFSLIRFMPVDV